MERHSEGVGDALQLLDGGISLATTDAVQILLRPAYLPGQCCFTHVFFSIAFFKSIFVYLFICFNRLVVIQKGPLAAHHRRGPVIIGLGGTGPSHYNEDTSA